MTNNNSTHQITNENRALEFLQKNAKIKEETRAEISRNAIALVEHIRSHGETSTMELFLGEYGLSSVEGVALMCLAEALLRVPDGVTMDALIEDKIAPSEWGRHLGHSHSPLVNASTWALFLTGKVLRDDENQGVASVIRGAIKRLGEPVIRQAVNGVMKQLGAQFVLGQSIQEAVLRGKPNETLGLTHSYDMLGEAALTASDAEQYFRSYSEAIIHLGSINTSKEIADSPGISVKLSALFARYETAKHERVMAQLVPKIRALALLAKSASIGLNIDAEEAARLGISMDIIEAVATDPSLFNWNGFGVVVQAYNLRAPEIIDRLYELAKQTKQKIMVRLVKGAYWDTEIKLAQVEGHEEFPVFTRKPSTDVSYLCCAKKLLEMRDHIYPQFATHNAHSVAAILEFALEMNGEISGELKGFEFQRLHGMGEALHKRVFQNYETRCRIYAPVGTHKDLLAYLVRRLLENGANSSFVNQIVDENVPPETVVADPFDAVAEYLGNANNPHIHQPCDLYAPTRQNSRGWDLSNSQVLAEIERGLSKFDGKIWGKPTQKSIAVINPANGDTIGWQVFFTAQEASSACADIKCWRGSTASQRAAILNHAADLYEENAHALFSLLMAEAGKTLLDCVGELREAVDFLRYYASQTEKSEDSPAGIFTCISPWNFPLAIFTGQIAAALGAGNGVLAKPAETTTLIAEFATSLLHRAGVPNNVLILIPGTGKEVGSILTSNSIVDGICFTGSTLTARIINQSIARNLPLHTPLIAETGGLNAMIVDSTALPEQAVGDILASVFQSAGQRCSALRILYLQEDIADEFLAMLFGAMDELEIGDPRKFTTDIGPVIDETAKRKIESHIAAANADNRVLKQLPILDSGNFVGPAVIRVSGIEALEEEIFGPVLHVATYKAVDFERLMDSINDKEYGLTFGLHSRIDSRVQTAIDKIKSGNIYINRNQIGAVVGSQPFGGEGLSGTGPKAGGPHYLNRFRKVKTKSGKQPLGQPISLSQIESAFSATPPTSIITTREMPGPTGESNQLSSHPRGRVLCLGPSPDEAKEQAKRACKAGCNAIAVAPGLANGLDGIVTSDTIRDIPDLGAVVCWSNDMRDLRLALAERNGPIVAYLNDIDFEEWLKIERHVCIDTTAAGGNTALLSQ